MTNPKRKTPPASGTSRAASGRCCGRRQHGARPADAMNIAPARHRTLGQAGPTRPNSKHSATDAQAFSERRLAQPTAACAFRTKTSHRRVPASMRCSGDQQQARPCGCGAPDLENPRIWRLNRRDLNARSHFPRTTYKSTEIASNSITSAIGDSARTIVLTAVPAKKNRRHPINNRKHQQSKYGPHSRKPATAKLRHTAN